MKRKIILIGSFLALVLVLFACHLNENERIETNELNENELSLKKINEIYEQLHPNKSQTIFLGNRFGVLQQTSLDKAGFKSNSDLEIKKYSVLISEGANFNNILETQNRSNLNIISINYFADQNIVGFAIYYISNNNMYVKLYKINNNQISKIDGFPKIVNDVVFQDVNYIGSKYFKNKNILSYIVKYNKPKLEKNYNDLELERIVSILNINRSIKQSKNTSAKLVMEAAVCSMAVPQCQVGNGTRCTYGGCTKSCTKMLLDSMTARISEEDEGEEESTDLAKSLPATILYQFESKLNSSSLGSEYVNFYYSIGEHFIDAVQTSDLWDIFIISPRIKEAIEKFNNNENVVIVDNNLYNDIQSIMLNVKNNSRSEIFRTAVNDFLNELNLYKGKTAIEIDQILNAN